MFSCIIRIGAIAAAAFLATACASSPARQGKFSSLVVVDDSESLAYFYRPKTFTAGGVWYDIKLDGRNVASLPNCSFSYAKVPPGEYDLLTVAHPSVSMAPKPTKIVLTAGSRHFFLLDIDGSFYSAGNYLVSQISMGWRETSEAQAVPLLHGCDHVQPDTTSHAKASGVALRHGR